MSIPFLIILCAAFVVLLEGPLFIPLLKRLKFGQTIRMEGPRRHLSKTGTPTMGGLMFLPALFIVIPIFAKASLGLGLAVFAFIGFGALGAWDDLLKIAWRRSLGLTVLQKLAGQFALAFFLLFTAVNFLGRGTDIHFPGNFIWEAGWLYYLLMAPLLVFMVNAVNLTDGLDGLAAGISGMVFLGWGIICLAAQSLPPILGLDYTGLSVFAFTMTGVCLGFLFYNRYPARIFMGDTGSLAIGGGLAALAVLCKMEIFYLVLGGVYVAEAASVVLQVASFKIWGRRIFRMSPLHHHFEMLGWKETRVVALFWLVAAVCVILGMMLIRL